MVKKISKSRATKKVATKLTHKQLAQVEQNIEKRIEELTYQGAITAIVISHLGYQVICQPLQTDANTDNQLLACDWRQNLGSLCVGDRVLITLEAEKGVVEAVLPRKNVIEKYNTYKGARALAANIDLLLVVLTLKPLFQPSLLDRYLVSANRLGLETYVFFNKVDLLVDADTDTQKMVTECEQIYSHIPDCHWLNGSAKQGLGLDVLQNVLANKVTVIAGQSGVGKSSLINALIPDLNIQTKSISEVSGLGRHSTTNSTLYHLSETGLEQGSLIDTPGVRSFETVHYDKTVIEAGYREIAPFLGRCQFSDCSHTHEKNCSIISALNDKAISQLRYDSFIQMLSEVENEKTGK